MPELPDIAIYIERLSALTKGKTLNAIRLASPFFLRSAEPPIASIEKRAVVSIGRLGKRIVFDFDGEFHLVIHLMIAGRLHWGNAGKNIPRSKGLAALDFDNGSLIITESGMRKRASMHLVQGAKALEAFDPQGIEPLQTSEDDFRAALTCENHTIKRTLTDPWIISGIGNAYSDEILLRAKLSPYAQTQKLSDEEIHRLYDTTKIVLNEWIDRLRREAGDGFPEKVTAFRSEMVAHGKYGQPCLFCGTAIQRIRYADNETNYCPTCQTGGKLLADRALSALLKKDWPKTLEELERLNEKHREAADPKG